MTVECSGNTFTGVHVWREYAFGEACRYCGARRHQAPPEATLGEPGRAPRNPRSDEAWESLTSERKAALRNDVLTALREHGPLTTEEIEAALGDRHQSVSGCMSRMWHDEYLIRPTGVKRPTSSGRLADVYEIGSGLDASEEIRRRTLRVKKAPGGLALTYRADDVVGGSLILLYIGEKYVGSIEARADEREHVCASLEAGGWMPVEDYRW